MHRKVADESEIKVLCVDDNRDFADLMRLVIDGEPGLRCAGCLYSADELEAQIHVIQPHVVLLDASMPGKDPLEALRDLQSRDKSTRAIVCSGYDDRAFVDRVLRAGAWGCVSKQDEPKTIMHAVREVAAGRHYFPALSAHGNRPNPPAI